jgi:hypothetical protein
VILISDRNIKEFFMSDFLLPAASMPAGLTPVYSTLGEVIDSADHFRPNEVTRGFGAAARGFDRLMGAEAEAGQPATTLGRGRLVMASLSHWSGHDLVEEYLTGTDDLDPTKCSQVNAPGCGLLSLEIIEANTERGRKFEGVTGLYNTLGAIGRAHRFNHPNDDAAEILGGPLLIDGAIGKPCPIGGKGHPNGWFKASPLEKIC